MSEAVENKAQSPDKPTFNVLYVGDSFSRLSFFRGDVVLKAFSVFYEKYANTIVFTATPNRLHSFSMEDLKQVNTLWLDNTTDAYAVQKINEVQLKIMDELNPNWRVTLTELKKESEEKAIEFVKGLKDKRAERLRVIYALDEFVWEGPAGRSQSVQTVHLIENYLNVSDTIVVPTFEMREALEHFNLCNKHIDIAVVPTSISHEFFPLFKKVDKDVIMNASSLPKPKLLIKGITIPENVQEFIMRSYKEYDITISSVGELNSHILTLVGRKQLTHIYHWANPGSNKRNFSTTYAIERDVGFDFLIFCMPEELNDRYYDITMGDEDVLFAIASGTLPISVTKHIEFEPAHLTNASGLTVDTKAGVDVFKKIIKNHYYDHQTWNLAFNKCRMHIENRFLTSPYMMATYFGVLIGRKKAEKKKAAAAALLESRKKENLSSVDEVDSTSEQIQSVENDKVEDVSPNVEVESTNQQQNNEG